MIDSTIPLDGFAKPVPMPQVRRIGIADLRIALARGVEDFRAIPSQYLFLCVFYPVIGLVLGKIASGDRLLPLLFTLVSGFALVGPVAAIGLYELSRRRENGLDVSWRHAFAIVRSPSIGAIIEMTVLFAVMFFFWLVAAQTVYQWYFGDAIQPNPQAFLRTLLGTSAGWHVIVVGNAVGFVFAVATLAIGVVSFPLLIDRRVSALTAMATSVKAMIVNPVPILVWGLIVAFLLALGTLPVLIGLIVVMPVLGHASWHLYRRIVVP